MFLWRFQNNAMLHKRHSNVTKDASDGLHASCRSKVIYVTKDAGSEDRPPGLGKGIERERERERERESFAMASQKARKSFAMASHRASWCHCGNCQHPEALQSCLWRPCPRAQLAQSHWNQFGWCVFARHRWANFETLHHKHVLVISWWHGGTSVAQ